MAEEESQAQQKKNEERREKECYGRKRGSSLYYCTVENWCLISINLRPSSSAIRFLADSMILAEEESQACQKKDKERREKECYGRKRGSSLYYCTVEKLVSINLRTNSSVIS